MHQLTIIGLGPGSMSFLTLEAYKTLKASEVVYVRTLKHPVIDELVAEGVHFQSFDEVYESSETFDEVYETIAAQLAAKLESGSVVYAVPGNPFVAERSVELLMEQAEALPVDIQIIHGTSFIDAIITTLHKDPVKGLHIVDALQIEQFDLDNRVDQLVIQIYDPMVGSNVKLELMKAYPDDHEVWVVRGAGIPGVEEVHRLPLYELDRCEALDHLASVYIPAVEDPIERQFEMSDLVRIMERLRGEGGCPWDMEQTHDSLKQYLLEEAYEVIDTIESDDLYGLEEELGDVLLQVVFHSTIANENGYFSTRDVISGICRKLILRHPHVFGEVHVNNSDEVLLNWEAIKRQEKDHETVTEAMEALPMAMPATMRAFKIQKKAAQVGFDWDVIDDAIAKIKEELDEFLEALSEADEIEMEKELGDILFAVINVCRFAKVNPELALSKTNEKFVKRFHFIETSERAKMVGLSKMTLEEMDELWNIAKNQAFDQKN